MKLYFSQGMSFHGLRAIKCLGFEPYDQHRDNQCPTMFWLYSADDYKHLFLHKGKSFIFWHGSDVLFLYQHRKNFLPILRQSNPVCACHNEVQQNFLAEMGIFAHIRPIFWNDVQKYTPSNKPFTKQVYITSHPLRENQYGEPMMHALAEALSEWKFHIFGTEKSFDVKENVFYHGNVAEEIMDAMTEDHAVTLRWQKVNGQHWDGVSQTVMKALLRGQMAITGIKYPFAYHAKGISDIVQLLKNYDLLQDTLPKIKINEFDWLEM